MESYSILVDFSPTFYCLPKPLFLYGSMVLLSYISTITLLSMYYSVYVFKEKSEFCYDCRLCMVTNISVQYNGGFLPDIILLTQGYYY